MNDAVRWRHLVTIYHAQELCRRHSFEEVAYLRWHGELPTREQVCAQNRVERAQRALSPQVAAALARQPAAADPIDTVREALGAERATAVRLFAVLPAIVAADQRLRQGLGVIAAREHLGYAANFLSMTFGKVPEPQIVAAFETALILYGGHISPAAAVPSRPAVPTRTGRPTPRSARSSDQGKARPARPSSR
jgi:citrate synthase